MQQIGYNREAQPQIHTLYNLHTVKSLQSLTTYMFGKATLSPMLPIPLEGPSAYYYGQSLPYPLAGNFIVRLFCCIGAFNERAYWKIAGDVASLAGLYFMGPQASVVIDCATEAANLYYLHNGAPILEKLRGLIPPEFWGGDSMDCTVPETALAVLGLSEAEGNDPVLLDRRYQELHREWTVRIDGSQNSPPLLAQFTKLLNRVEISYQTLKKHHQN